MIRDPKKNLVLMVAAAACLLACLEDAHAYRLPEYEMTPEEAARPAEENLSLCDAKLGRIQSVVRLGIAGTRRRDYKKRLTPAQRKATADYDGTKIACDFWSYVTDLKSKLAGLHRDPNDPEVKSESDAMAKTIVQKIYELSQEYDVAFSAIVQNILVNKGKRKKGHCYHYVSDIRAELWKRRWRMFDLYWGEAWPDTYRENNALVITAKGKPFETGIAVDSWRTAGKPFWTEVRGDRFPWEDAGFVAIEEP